MLTMIIVPFPERNERPDGEPREQQTSAASSSPTTGEPAEGNEGDRHREELPDKAKGAADS